MDVCKHRMVWRHIPNASDGYTPEASDGYTLRPVYCARCGFTVDMDHIVSCGYCGGQATHTIMTRYGSTWLHVWCQTPYADMRRQSR